MQPNMSVQSQSHWLCLKKNTSVGDWAALLGVVWSNGIIISIGAILPAKSERTRVSSLVSQILSLSCLGTPQGEIATGNSESIFQPATALWSLVKGTFLCEISTTLFAQPQLKPSVGFTIREDLHPHPCIHRVPRGAGLLWEQVHLVSTRNSSQTY